jgi:hypothetical protein
LKTVPSDHPKPTPPSKSPCSTSTTTKTTKKLGNLIRKLSIWRNFSKIKPKVPSQTNPLLRKKCLANEEPITKHVIFILVIIGIDLR